MHLYEVSVRLAPQAFHTVEPQALPAMIDDPEAPAGMAVGLQALDLQGCTQWPVILCITGAEGGLMQ